MSVYVSPGVYTREVDLSLYVPALSTTIVGMVGVSSKGPTNVRTYITNQQQFVETFGAPDSSIGYESYAALQYLRRGRQLWFVRVVGDSAAAATDTLQYGTDVEAENPAPTPAFDNATKSFVLAAFSNLGDDGIKPGSVTITFTMSDDSTETFTDNGAGVLVGSVDGAGSIVYSTGVVTMAFGTLAPKTASTVDADYTYLTDAVAVSAISEGEWGNNISITVEDGSLTGTKKINVFMDGVAVESFNNVDLDDTTGNTQFIETKINDVSEYITVDLDTDLAGGSSELPTNLTSTFAMTLSGGDTDASSVSATEINGVAWDDTLSSPTGLQLFASPSAVDINLIAAPGWSDAAVVNQLILIAESRADCLAIIDPPENLRPSEVVDWHNGTGDYAGQHSAFNSSYAACYWPWVKVYDSYNGAYAWTPPSGHALAVFAYTDQSTESWFAPAGISRGRVISGIDVEMGATPGEMDLLYGDQNAINPIAKFTKDGLVIWGQRTLQRAPTALDRINVRRLLLYLRKVISTAVRYLVFEPNDEKTWRLFGHLVIPFLNDVTQRRGLYDFRVKCDETTNTPAVIDRNEMHAQIFLKPVKAAEFIQVDLVITATGANFDEILY
jgi:phage tail sheath protein FI